MSALDEVAFRESVFAWLRAKMLVQPVFTRKELSNFEFNGLKYRLVGSQTGIWKPRELGAALSMLTAFDGPTLQHALKEMNGESLRQLPVVNAQRPSKELLAERFEQFLKAS